MEIYIVVGVVSAHFIIGKTIQRAEFAAMNLRNNNGNSILLFLPSQCAIEMSIAVTETSVDSKEKSLTQPATAYPKIVDSSI